jgi:hypothetical protein
LSYFVVEFVDEKEWYDGLLAGMCVNQEWIQATNKGPLGHIAVLDYVVFAIGMMDKTHVQGLDM